MTFPWSPFRAFAVLYLFYLVAPLQTLAANCHTALDATGELKLGLDRFFSKHGGQLNPSNRHEIEPLLTKENLVSILTEIKASPQLLAKVAALSYTHSLGFTKITLLEDWDGQGYDVRLHIWWPQKVHDARETKEAKEEPVAAPAPAPAAEGRHEHRWDFVSRMISGSFESHNYMIRELTVDEAALFSRFERTLATLEPDQIIEILDRFDLMEIATLTPPDSQLARALGGAGQARVQVDETALQRLFGMTSGELQTVANIYVKYTTHLDLEKGQERYWSLGPRMLNFAELVKHQEGELYYQSVQFAHRLFVDPSTFVSTFVLTAPPRENQDPGEFVHSSIGRESKAIRGRTFFTPERLKIQLEQFLRAINH